MEGVLFKLGGGALGSWQKRFCKIVGTELRYYDAETADEAKYKGSVELSQSEVHDRGAAGTDKPCFSIEGRAEGKKGGKEYFFHTKDNADKFRWVTALMRATGHPLYNYLTAVADPAAERHATLERLAKSSLWNAGLLTGANEVCADCEAPLPTWAVVSSTTGVVICIECVGVHRNLWAGSCKEVQLDHWRDEDVALLAARGNAAVNAELEACVPLSTPKPVPHSSRAVREAFIAKKYHRAFITTENATTQPPPRDGAPVPRLDDSRASISVPPKYIGVAFFVAQRLVAAESSQIPSKPHLVLANGFQFVTSSKAGDTVSGDALSVQWNEGLQIGIDDLRRPLTLTITEGAPEKMLVKATFPLVPKGYDPTEEPTPITIHGTDSHHKTVTFHGLLSFSSLT